MNAKAIIAIPTLRRAAITVMMMHGDKGWVNVRPSQLIEILDRLEAFEEGFVPCKVIKQEGRVRRWVKRIWK